MNNDLISREALKKAICDKGIKAICEKGMKGYEEYNQGLATALDLIDNAPTELFPLTVEINDNVTDEDIENLKQLMKGYKPQILNLEPKRLQGEWVPDAGGYQCNKCFDHALEINGIEIRSNFCPNCGADMRGKDDE